MNAIIFGINGQDGFYLSQQLQKQAITIIGVSRSGGKYLSGNVSDFHFVNELIQKTKPTYIFHLAANSTTRHDAILENYETITTGTLNILESVKKHSPFTKVFITGSGLQFQNTGKPISELDKFDFSNSYSLVRNQSVFATRYYRTFGIKIYVGYLFHHESPLRGGNHVSKIIVNGAKRISAGSKEKIEIGDISVKKEWTFANDIMNGVLTLVNQDQIFEATIGSGKAYSIADWLYECFAIIGKDWNDHVDITNNFKAEYSILYSNPETINKCGWSATTSLDELAKIMMA